MDPKTWKQWNIWNAATYIIARGARQYCQGRFSGRFRRGQARGKVAPWKMAEPAKEKGAAGVYVRGKNTRSRHTIRWLSTEWLLCGLRASRRKNIVDILCSRFRMPGRCTAWFVIVRVLDFVHSFALKLRFSLRRNSEIVTLTAVVQRFFDFLM